MTAPGSNELTLWPIVILSGGLVGCSGDLNVGWSEGAGKVGAAAYEVQIGGIDRPAEQVFHGIADILVARSGVVWILEGDLLGRQTPRLRRYDAAGRYINEVGAMGRGPGEYSSPYALGELKDGRVILRDARLANRLTIYSDGGAFDTTWTFDRPLHGLAGSRDVLEVDTSGLVWVQSSGERPARGGREGVGYVHVRLLSDGTILDSVRPPEIPNPPRASMYVTRRTATGGMVRRGFFVPYQPTVFTSWSPDGRYATGATNRYRVDVFPPTRVGDVDSVDPVFSIRRELSPVEVGSREREDLRERLAAQITGEEGEASGPIPEIPQTKPPVKSVEIAEDGRVWVGVSVPSEERTSEGREPVGEGSALVTERWWEPMTYDVFEPSGVLRGRVTMPHEACAGSARAVRRRGDLIWCVTYVEHDVEVLRRYRIIWHRADGEQSH